MTFDRSALDAAKQAVPISTAWRALGLTGEPARTCCSPFREERHASFSISTDGLLWHDFTTGKVARCGIFIFFCLDNRNHTIYTE
jgi:hypothetical protein